MKTLALYSIIALLGFCQHLTVAPLPPKPTQIDFDENQQNAGVIDCDANGCLVTTNWMNKYKLLERKFNRTIGADAHILQISTERFRISYEVYNNWFEMLKRKN